ncbi:MAG: autotransporter domain-containing protein [Alphaproteobacteria bacterium]|nr:autotransporter domain-containing protein [Alphaproteobacteria bacterium]
MFKNKTLFKTTGLVSLVALGFATMPSAAQAYNLAPLSFNRMYNLAQNGEVEALRASVRRGMNIDTVNQNGDTGLCVAAQHRDAYTYNAFRAAGANPRHPCVQRIPYYKDFVNSSKAVSVTATPREAYGQMGKESYKISSTTWWILGGLAVGGGIAALAMGGGGGGGGSSSGNSGSSESNSYIGDGLGSLGSIYNTTSGKSSNSNLLKVNNPDIKKIAQINFNENPVEAGKYMHIGLEAANGGTYTNNKNAKISINEGSAAMAAVNNSEVINNGYINADAFNGSVAMIASNNSTAYNNGKGVIQDPDSNGINLNFSGYAENNTIIGMYADGNSQIINTGEINGSATKAISDPTSSSGNSDSSSGDSSSSTKTTAVSGTIIGMETMIINSGSQALNDTNTAVNSGTIKLSAGDAGAAASEVKVNIIGMGSYLDDGFLNGSKNIQRAEKSVLTNNETIDLGYTGQYTFDSTKTLRKGLGGIVGMRADANTTATNSGNIKITLDDKSSSDSEGGSSSDSVAVAAGMQSVHGGTITNNKNGTITIQTNGDNQRITYGMLAVEGTGSVSGLYTTTKPTVTNNGTIQLNASNGYGMASYNGGTLINSVSGIINLGDDTNATLYTNNIGMYGSGDSTLTSLVNNGQINVYSSNSTAMKNDYSGSTTIANNGTIHIYNNAVGSNVFGGNYSNAVNNGTIIYEATNSSSSSGSDATNLLNIKQNVMNTKSPSRTSSVTSSETETITNSGTITITSADTSAMTVASKQGTATNTGTINLNSNGTNYSNTGMHLTSDAISVAKIVNQGTINVNTGYSAGMSSAASSIANMINDSTGVINVKGTNSFGMYATGNSHITNNGIINVYGDGNTAIYSAGTGEGKEIAVIRNNIIKIFGKNATVFHINGKAEIEEVGRVRICDPSADGAENCSKEAAETLTYYLVSGDLTIKKNLSIEQGNLIKLTDSSNVTINNGVQLSITKQGTIIDATNGSGTITNNGSLRLINTNNSTAVKVGKATFNNNGTIEIASVSGFTPGSSNTAVDVAEGGKFNNSSQINVNTDSSYGVKSSGTTVNSGIIAINGSDGKGVIVSGGEFTNAGSITVGSATNYISNGAGIVVNGGSAKNEGGTITIYGSNSHGVSVRSGNFTNSGNININQSGGSTSYGIYLTGGTATNNGTITVSGGAVKCSGLECEDKNTATQSSFIMVKNDASFINNGTIKYNSDIDFDAATENNGSISVGKNGTYEASALKGTVTANADITQSRFDTTYRNNDSFIGKDAGLNIVSGSYMFNAEKAANESGNTDVIMTMKSFDETVADKELASYLSTNYAAQKGEGVFNTLKGAGNASAFDMALNREFGFSMLPNLAKQDLDLLSNINRAANDDILAQTNEINRAKVNVMAYQQEFGGKHNVSGYKDKVTAVYGFSDYQIANNWRAGLGAAAAHSDSDFDDGSSRYNNVLEVFTPLTYTNDNFRAMAKPKVGFGKGHYSRSGVDKAYKADLTNYYYGIDAEARQTIDLDVAQLEPVAGANITEVKVDSLKENNGGLKADSDKVTSVQSVIGMDIKKDFDLGKEQSILLTAGGRYFHEFGSKYSTMATMDNMLGSYQINSNRLQRNSGLLSVKAQYDYKKLSLSAAVNAPLEQKSNVYYLFNLGYKF